MLNAWLHVRVINFRIIIIISFMWIKRKISKSKIENAKVIHVTETSSDYDC